MGWFHNTFFDYKDKLRRYYPFSPDEIKALLITIFACTFIVAYNDGSSSFNLVHWLGNFFIWFIIVAFSILWYETGHRVAGLMANHKVEYSVWWYGIIIGVIIAVVSRGQVWVLIPGGILLRYLEIQRMGWFRFGVNIYALSLISLGGPIAAFLLAALIKTPELWLGLSLVSTDFVSKVFLFNLAFAAWNLLPIPPLDGSRIFFHSRLIYSFVFGSFAAYALLAFIGFYSYLLAILIGAAFAAIFYLIFEKEAWGGGYG